MRFVVIGGSGLIGSQVVRALAGAGHEAVPVSKSTGVDVVSGEGLAAALRGADVVVDVTNSPSFEDDAVMEFFRASTGNQLAAEAEAGVGHHVVLSIVGVDQVPGVGYYRAKAAQEDIVRGGRVPYSIVRATQFFEFVDDILSWTTDGDVVRLPSTLLQPAASADVAANLAEVAAGEPLNGVRDIAGPDVFRLDELGRLALASKNSGLSVVTDESAGLLGGIGDGVLTAGEGAVVLPTRYEEWLRRR
ncbi:SDR family oxidoreductase [Actinorugispora endophytica]|uniref:Uncharacterized protein YbjT (DUF2867 family) n=1 Tax=Actinorugispora endophytica TaxID=1605990 RepID=A0A4R6V019_9ACTN|nr:NAD(P)H-binding protein [Actinorugispora endophytica]TDQ53274.1 uncharacterized protein YbjT (DUF2867 family) [Actinorugispora endophytica]